jgi:hypothetical protein
MIERPAIRSPFENKLILSVYNILSIDLLETWTTSDVNRDNQPRRSSALQIEAGDATGVLLGMAGGSRHGAEHAAISIATADHPDYFDSMVVFGGFMSHLFDTAPLALIVKQALAPRAPGDPT